MIADPLWSCVMLLCGPLCVFCGPLWSFAVFIHTLYNESRLLTVLAVAADLPDSDRTNRLKRAKYFFLLEHYSVT